MKKKKKEKFQLDFQRIKKILFSSIFIYVISEKLLWQNYATIFADIFRHIFVW